MSVFISGVDTCPYLIDLPSSHLSDGGNIMGARRAASIVANSLECKSWLRQEEGGALSNPFEAFWDESSSDEESEVE